MTTYEINLSLTPYQSKTLVNIANTQVKPDSENNSSNAKDTQNASLNSQTFVQSVLQSLQDLGVNTSDIYADNSSSSNANDALNVFLQDLYKTITQGKTSQPSSSIIGKSVTSNLQSSEDVATQTKMVGGTNFQYTVDLSQADLGNYLEDVKGSLKTALENIGQYISSKAVFNLKVLTTNVDSNMLAQTNSSLMTTTNSQSGSNVDTTFVVDSIRGADSYPDTPDATLYINLAKIGEMSFSGSPPPDKYDLTSILTHEILHGLAFTGTLGGNPSFKTAYDSMVTTQNAAVPTFVGRHAATANLGNPVPLSSASSGEGSAYYHVAIPGDLMSESIRKGEVKGISDLDIAMLEDMGIGVTGVSPTLAKLQNTYNPSANLNNLMDSIGRNDTLETGLTNLVHALGGSVSSSTANLHNFLTAFAMNTINSNSIKNSSGSLFSVTA